MQYAKQTHVLRRPDTTDGSYVEGETVTERQEVEPSKASRAQQIVYVTYGIVTGLLLVRFVFAVFAANPSNPFAGFIYSVTRPLVSPFQSLFGAGSASYKGSRIEIYTLIAISVYGLLAWLIIRLAGINKDAARRDVEV